jgi:hypothetical protein
VFQKFDFYRTEGLSEFLKYVDRSTEDCLVTLNYQKAVVDSAKKISNEIDNKITSLSDINLDLMCVGEEIQRDAN